MEETTSKARNILGAALMIAGLSVLVWLVAGEVNAPEPAETVAQTSETGIAGTNLAQTGQLESIPAAESESTTTPERAAEDVAEADESIFAMGAFPASIKAAPDIIQQAYRFASSRKNHEVLEYQTCYCGCDMSPVLRHNNLLDCYFKKILPEDKVVYEEHAMVCSMCLNEAWDTEKWVAQGKSADQIKVLIDSKYGRF